MKSQAGFTLIELLTVIAIIGVLSALGVTNLAYYKANAAYASATTTMHNARNALEAGLSDPDNLPGAVGLTSQTSQGSLTNVAAAALLPGMLLPSDVKFQVEYDPACSTGACQSDFLQVNHCFGREYIRFLRFGDGVELYLDHIDGVGCP